MVRVCFSIDGDGNVESARVVHSDLYPRGYSYAKSLVRKAALTAIRQWTFAPAGTGPGPRKACRNFRFSDDTGEYVPP